AFIDQPILSFEERQEFFQIDLAERQPYSIDIDLQGAVGFYAADEAVKEQEVFSPDGDCPADHVFAVVKILKRRAIRLVIGFGALRRQVRTEVYFISG